MATDHRGPFEGHISSHSQSRLFADAILAYTLGKNFLAHIHYLTIHMSFWSDM